jgi:hypothetical protein
VKYNCNEGSDIRANEAPTTGKRRPEKPNALESTRNPAE